MAKATDRSEARIFSRPRAWVPAAGALLGVLAAFSAYSGRDSLVGVVTAIAGGSLGTWALAIGALSLGPSGKNRERMQTAAACVGFCVATAAAGWRLDYWPGILVGIVQGFNGAMVGHAVYDLIRFFRKLWPGVERLEPSPLVAASHRDHGVPNE